MPIRPPRLDERSYRELRDELLARVPVHTPEWTNLNESDPGVTLVELFSFLTESLIYRANLIPDRNRQKLLSLLGVSLRPASSARGIVTFDNARGPREALPLHPDIEVRAGEVPFRTLHGLSVLPIQARVLYKKKVAVDDNVRAQYRRLYQTHTARDPSSDLDFYRTEGIDGRGLLDVDFDQTVDGSVWICLATRNADPMADETLAAVRQAIGGRTLSLGVVPRVDERYVRLGPSSTGETTEAAFRIYAPRIPSSGRLGDGGADRTPQYRLLESRALGDVARVPGIIEVQLPRAEELVLWNDIDPLEAGVGDLPPSLEDTSLANRIITWLRIRPTPGTNSGIHWVGANASTVEQRLRVIAEQLGIGTGEPDQELRVSHGSFVGGSIRLSVESERRVTEWKPIDDLFAAGAELQRTEGLRAPGIRPERARPTDVFVEDPEAGTLRFGDGVHGRRPPRGATLRATYDVAHGRAGNVAAGAIKSAIGLPPGIAVENGVSTWGGADAATTDEGERQVSAFIRHRDRAVTRSDFEEIALRTPGVDVGRVEAVSAYSPTTPSAQAGDVPGAVTLLVIPRWDPRSPDAPQPSAEFLRSVADFVDRRRLITTELYVAGPVYRDLWVSIGVTPREGVALHDVIEEVKARVRALLSPLADVDAADPWVQPGWPLGKAVTAAELAAVASRAAAVLTVNQVKLSSGTDAARDSIAFSGLELPRLVQLSVSIGDAIDLAHVRGSAPSTNVTTNVVPVPVVPEDCC